MWYITRFCKSIQLRLPSNKDQRRSGSSDSPKQCDVINLWLRFVGAQHQSNEDIRKLIQVLVVSQYCVIQSKAKWLETPWRHHGLFSQLSTYCKIILNTWFLCGLMLFQPLNARSLVHHSRCSTSTHWCTQSLSTYSPQCKNNKQKSPLT